MKRISQAEIAALAGVSRSTVACALNPKRRDKLRAETRRRIEEVARDLNYRPHRYAQIMRDGRSGMIGILRFPGYSDFRVEMELRTQAQIRDAGYQPVLVRADGTAGEIMRSCDDLLDAQVEGVILDGPSPTSIAEVVECFRAIGVPMVMLSGTDVEGIVHVRSDMRAGLLAMTEHLVGLGHRRVTYLLNWTDTVRLAGACWRTRDRLAGFCEGVRAAGGTIVGDAADLAAFGQRAGGDPAVAPLPGLVGEVVLHRSRHQFNDLYMDGLHAAEDRLARGDLPDVLVCNNDDWAVGAMRACARAGLRVPADVAITGHDDIGIGPYLTPALTTARHPIGRSTRAAVRILLDLIRGQPAEQPIVALPSELIVRESCGAAARLSLGVSAG